MSSSPTPELPDIYAPAQQLLSMLNLSNRALLSRNEDPLPQALAGLIDYDMATANRMADVQDAASMYELLSEEPTVFLNHLLLGRLVYASPLGPVLAAIFAPDDTAEEEELYQRRTKVLTYVAHTTGWYYPMMESTFLVERYPEEYQAAVRQERAELHAAVEAAFAEWQHSLGSLLLPAPAPVMPLAANGWSLQPMRIQLEMLALAASMACLLPSLSSHAFAQAVAQLPDFHPQRLEELSDYLKQATADERLSFGRGQGLLLYVAAHLTMMLFVNDVLEVGGLDDLVLRSGKRQNEFGSQLPELVAKLRETAAAILSGYIEEVRTSESDAADFQALEARLGPVLALAST